MSWRLASVTGVVLLCVSGAALAATGGWVVATPPELFGIRVEFLLFALMLLGIAAFHHYTFGIALTGAVTIICYKLLFTGFAAGPGFGGLATHLLHEWIALVNLLLMLLGFVVVARHFEKSHVPVILPKYLPDDWRGALVLLIIVFVLSGFLDNIAAAMIGGAMAHQLFRARVHIGYLAAIVAASNAGGAGSVIGDTTTLMMWVSGIAPLDVAHAYVGAAVALMVFGIPAALQQQRYSPILKHAHEHTHVDRIRVGIVAAILITVIVVNIGVNVFYPWLADHVPYFGITVWLVILASLPLRRPDWEAVGQSVKGSLFLVLLVLSASLMPLETLPPPTWQTAFTLGWVSSVFDNIPLTALAIQQGGYDWGLVAFAVGYGGSMIWFGSSAGVALTNLFPEGRSVVAWLRHGWHVAVGYVAGFMAMLWLLGWQPH
ncbi:MAG TPA: citrate transporter [Gammaproteobacteria bacterium]|nr:citrate transporter [Gammaproteobacteria bacterium]